MFTHPITHISPHSHSLGGKDDSHSYLASTANAGPINLGGEKKGLHSLTKRVGSLRNVHNRGHGYTYRSINSAELVHLYPQDHYHRRCAPPRLMPGYQPTSTMPSYHSALGLLGVHRHAETVRRSTGPQWLLCCLRRV